MTPQLYITVYKEQFSSPGRAKGAQLRPTSAHRRNNPHPRPDFLFPKSLQPNYISTNRQPHLSSPLDNGRPLFPPVKHLSFHSPVVSFRSRTQRIPPVSPVAEEALTSADKMQKLQLTQPAQINPPQRIMQRNVHPLSARQYEGVQLRTRPQTSGSPAASHHFPHIQNSRSSSNGTLDHSSCYSCFHVVKPHQAGHYIIHPEFVSECLC